MQCCGPRFVPWVGKISWRREWQPTPVFLSGKLHVRRSPVGYSPWDRKESDTTEPLHFTSQVALVIKNLPASAGDVGSIPGLGRSPGEGNGNPLQYPCLENPRSMVGYSAWGRRVRHVWVTHTHTYKQARTWESRPRFKLIVKTVCLYIRYFEIRITVNAINANTHGYGWFVLVI